MDSGYIGHKCLGNTTNAPNTNVPLACYGRRTRESRLHSSSSSSNENVNLFCVCEPVNHRIPNAKNVYTENLFIVRLHFFSVDTCASTWEIWFWLIDCQIKCWKANSAMAMDGWKEREEKRENYVMFGNDVIYHIIISLPNFHGTKFFVIRRE